VLLIKYEKLYGVDLILFDNKLAKYQYMNGLEEQMNLVDTFENRIS
jgi:hypothetical protein